MKSGKLWVVGLLVLGAGAGLFSVVYWRQPENRVRWSFSQLHSALLRKRVDASGKFVADRVNVSGKEMSRDEFLATYVMEPKSDLLVVTPCAKIPGHWDVALRGRIYCFVFEGKLWKLHGIGDAAETRIH